MNIQENNTKQKSIQQKSIQQKSIQQELIQQELIQQELIQQELIQQESIQQIVISNQDKIKQIISQELENKLNEIKEPISESIIVNQEIKFKYIQIIQLVKLILESNESFNEIINKLKIIISANQSAQIKNFLNYLVRETNEIILLDNIIKESLVILSDNNLKLYEIPKLINVIHESLKNIQSNKINTIEISVLIQLFLFVLIETKTVKVSIIDYEFIFQTIDASMILLNKSIEIKIFKINKCLCF